MSDIQTLSNTAARYTNSVTSTTMLFQQVIVFLESIIEKVKHDFISEKAAELIQQLDDFHRHLEALRSYIDSRDESRKQLEITNGHLQEEIKHLRSLLEVAKSKPDINKTRDLDDESKKTELVIADEAPDQASISVIPEKSVLGKKSRENEWASNLLIGLGSKDDEGAGSESPSKKPRTLPAQSPSQIEEFETDGSTTEDDEAEAFKQASMRNKKRRGKLPDAATQILKKWLFDHWFHPYPSEEEKPMLCKQTNLTMNQINNWFTNARRRILPKTRAAQLSGSTGPSNQPVPMMHTAQPYSYLPRVPSQHPHSLQNVQLPNSYTSNAGTGSNTSAGFNKSNFPAGSVLSTPSEKPPPYSAVVGNRATTHTITMPSLNVPLPPTFPFTVAPDSSFIRDTKPKPSSIGAFIPVQPKPSEIPQNRATVPVKPQTTLPSNSAPSISSMSTLSTPPTQSTPSVPSIPSLPSTPSTPIAQASPLPTPLVTPSDQSNQPNTEQDKGEAEPKTNTVYPNGEGDSSSDGESRGKLSSENASGMQTRKKPLFSKWKDGTTDWVQ